MDIALLVDSVAKCANSACPGTGWSSILVGLVALWLYLFIAGLVSGRKGAMSFARSEDGRLSTSKFQFIIWTGVVVATYSAYKFALLLNHGRWTEELMDIPHIPQHVMWAMGLSAGTAATAKGIAAAYDASGRTAPTQKKLEGPDVGLLASDDDKPDLSKIQMLTWTAISIVVFLATAIHGLLDFAICPSNAASCAFPDIDATLLVLMGIGQGAYLGTKLAATDAPRITGIMPPTRGPSAVITLTGVDFGATPGTVTADYAPLDTVPTVWTDTQVVFSFPSLQPGGAPWPSGKVVQIALIVNGIATANSIPYTT